MEISRRIEMTEMSNLKAIGMVAAAIVIVSLFLPWMVATVSTFGISEDTEFTGIDIYNDGEQEYRSYPAFAAIAAILFGVLVLIDKKGMPSTIMGVALGLAVIISCILTYQSVSEYGFDFLVGTLEFTMGYGMILAIIGGLAMMVSAYLMNQ